MRERIAYLDTHVVVWLCENKVTRLSKRALRTINDVELLISPMVLAELGFIHEIGRIVRAPLELAKQLRSQIGVQVCDHSFSEIVETALLETWTRDPFDRFIVAHAKANGFARLITNDEKIRANYARAIW